LIEYLRDVNPKHLEMIN
jgi:hypothetical protein